jgi:hypothetical protein
VRVWGGVEDRAVRLKDRVVKSYENLRVVYEIETRLKDLEQQQETYDDQSRPAGQSATRQGNSQKGKK